MINRVAIGCVLGLLSTVSAQRVFEIVEMEESEYGAITARLRLSTLSNEINTAWMKRSVADTVALADRLIENAPEDFRGHALRYIAHVELGKDRKVARTGANRALQAMRKKPLQIVEFITVAMFAKPTRADYQQALMTLIPIVPEHRKVAAVRVAHLRALMGCGKVKEAVITNKNIVDDIGGDPAGLLLLASTICDMENARSLAGVADKAISKVLAKDSTNEAHMRVRYRILELLGREDEALQLGRKIIASVSRQGVGLNNWVWYLMTRRESAGKYPGLALLGAQEMMRASQHANYELDTIALALFRSKRYGQAVEYQQKAVQAGGDAQYRQRLEMYRAALREQQRQAGKDRKDHKDHKER